MKGTLFLFPIVCLIFQYELVQSVRMPLLVDNPYITDANFDRLVNGTICMALSGNFTYLDLGDLRISVFSQNNSEINCTKVDQFAFSSNSTSWHNITANHTYPNPRAVNYSRSVGSAYPINHGKCNDSFREGRVHEMDTFFSTISLPFEVNFTREWVNIRVFNRTDESLIVSEKLNPPKVHLKIRQCPGAYARSEGESSSTLAKIESPANIYLPWLITLTLLVLISFILLMRNRTQDSRQTWKDLSEYRFDIERQTTDQVPKSKSTAEDRISTTGILAVVTGVVSFIMLFVMTICVRRSNNIQEVALPSLCPEAERRIMLERLRHFRESTRQACPESSTECES
eukprot:474280_1